MKPWRYVIAMVRFQPWLFVASALTASTLFYLVPLLPGLIVREFFDALTDASSDSLGIWILLALLVGVGAGRMSGLILATACEITLNQYVEALPGRTCSAACWSAPAPGRFQSHQERR